MAFRANGPLDVDIVKVHRYSCRSEMSVKEAIMQDSEKGKYLPWWALTELKL